MRNEEPLSARVEIRLTEGEKLALETIAKASDRTLSSLLRQQVRALVKKGL